jgi:hypothetical protein
MTAHRAGTGALPADESHSGHRAHADDARDSEPLWSDRRVGADHAVLVAEQRFVLPTARPCIQFEQAVAFGLGEPRSGHARQPGESFGACSLLVQAAWRTVPDQAGQNKLAASPR